MQLFSADAGNFFYPQKLLRITQIHFFFLIAWVAQTEEFSKMWLIDQLYCIELGPRS